MGIMLAGKYVISDPCYLWENHDEWIALLERHNYFNVKGAKGGVFVEKRGGKGYPMAVSGTMYGDGGYKSNFRTEEFDVDAGMLSAIPVDLVEPSILVQPGTFVHEFKSEWWFEPCDSEGDIRFGDKIIRTGDGVVGGLCECCDEEVSDYE